MIETPEKCNGVETNGNDELASVPQLEHNGTNKVNMLMETENQFVEASEVTPPESALENLAKNLEAIGKYRQLQNDVKVHDMIAFKVMTVDFQISDYVIGLIEQLHGDTSIPSYDLTLLIMGEFLTSFALKSTLRYA